MNIQKTAVDIVIKYEKGKGRKAVEIPNGQGYDLKSGNRMIEVKGTSHGQPSLVPFSEFNVKGVRNVKNYYFYLVYDIKHKPTLVIFDRKKMLQKIKQLKVRVIDYSLPFEKKDYRRPVVL